MVEMVREPIFHTCTTFFFDNSFFLTLPFFEYATSNQLFYGEKCTFYAYTQTEHNRCRYELSHNASVSISTKKKPAFSRKYLFFCSVFASFTDDDFYTTFFSRGCSNISISICVYRFQQRLWQKSISQLCFLLNRKICKRTRTFIKYLHEQFTIELLLQHSALFEA